MRFSPPPFKQAIVPPRQMYGERSSWPLVVCIVSLCIALVLQAASLILRAVGS